MEPYKFNPLDFSEPYANRPMRIGSMMEKYKKFGLTKEQFSEMVHEFLPYEVVLENPYFWDQLSISLTTPGRNNDAFSTSLRRSQWCNANCKDYWTDSVFVEKAKSIDEALTFNHYRFRDESEAIMFKLMFGEKG